MKEAPLLFSVFGLFTFTFSVQAQTTVNISNLRIFQGTDVATEEPRSRFTGGVDLGTMLVSPNAPLFPKGNTSSPSNQAQFRIEDLDLDGVGAFDDWIEFTVSYNASRDGSSSNVNWSGAGHGVQGDLSPGNEEALTVTIENIFLSPGTAGAASFDGFTSAGMYLGANGTIVNGEADVNGTTYTDRVDATAGFTFNIGQTALTNAQSVVVDNVQVSDGDFRLRTIDFSITYDPNGTPEPTTVELAATALNPREDATYIYPVGTGGANLGNIVKPADFDNTLIEDSPQTDFRFRWEGLNLDFEGGDDDYFDFTIRATTGTETNVFFASLGIGGGGFGIENDEEITFEVVDITPKPGLTGTLEFNGFTGGGAIFSGNGPLETSTGQSQININGVTLMGSLTGRPAADVGRFVSSVLGVDFENPASTLVFNNGLSTNGPEDDFVVATHARNFDLSFTYTNGEPVTEVPVITNFGTIEEDTYFIEFTPGGTNYKVTTPTNGGLSFEEGSTEVESVQTNPNRFEFEGDIGSMFLRIEKK